MNLTKDINYNIFREYDIRGIYETDLSEDVIYTIGRAFGSKLFEQNKTETILGYDNRASSPIIYNALSKGITDSGINIINLGLVTTPMYYYALTMFTATSGIMITASHNAKEYNGLKLSLNGHYNTCGEEMKDFLTYLKEANFNNGNGTIKEYDITNDYINYLLSNINIKPLKVIIDCGNGTTSIIVKKIFEKLNLDIKYLFAESDSDFPNHQPDPTVEKNMEILKQEVLKEHANIGIGLDGDGDRIGVIDELGNQIKADKLMIIFIRDMFKTVADKRVIFDVKSTKALEDEILKLGGTPIQNRTGNSYTRKRLYEEKNLISGEYSGHICLADKFHGFDDGIYCALRILEIMSNTTKTISELLENINIYYTSDEKYIEVTEESKFDIVKQINHYSKESGYKVLELDGCKVLFDDGFALVRASNTTPSITTRYEAKTKERLIEITNEFENLIKKLT